MTAKWPAVREAPPGAGQLSGQARRFVATALVNQLGSGAFAGVLVLFFVRYLELRGSTASTLLSVAAGAGVAALVPMGIVADQVGAARLLRGSCVASFVAAGALAFLRPALAAGICYVLLVLCDRAFNVSRNGLLPVLVTGPGAISFKARVRAMSNLGYGLGAALGAVILTVLPATGFVVALLVNALSYAVCAILGRGLDQNRETSRSSLARPPGADLRYLCLAAVNGTLSLYLPVFELMLPLLVVTRFAGPSWIPGLCLSLSTAVVALGQTAATRGITDWVSSVRAARAGAAIAVGGLALIATGGNLSEPWVVVAAIVGTLVYVVGEMRGVAGQWELQMGFAPPDRQSRYQAVNAAGLGGARMLAPWLVGLMAASTWSGFAVLATIYAVAVVAAGPIAGWVKDDRGRRGVVAPGFGG